MVVEKLEFVEVSAGGVVSVIVRVEAEELSLLLLEQPLKRVTPKTKISKYLSAYKFPLYKVFNFNLFVLRVDKMSRKF